MVQMVYREARKRLLKGTVRQGEPLYTDGSGSQYEIGQLISSNELGGSGTFIDSVDHTRIVTHVTITNCIQLAVTSTDVTEIISSGALATSLASGDYFHVSHNQDVNTYDITDTIIGEDHAFILALDNSGAAWTFPWSGITIDGSPATIRWVEGSEPTLTIGGLDLFYFLLRDGIHLTVTYILDVGEDPNISALFPRVYNLMQNTEDYDISSARVLPVDKAKRMQGVVHGSDTQRTFAVRQTPIEVEGDATVGALQCFGTTPFRITATGINITQGIVSPVKFTSATVVSVRDTNTSLTISGGALTMPCSAGRQFDTTFDVDSLTLQFTGAPSSGYTFVNLTLFRDISGLDRVINWAATTVNGAIVPVLWEGKVEQALSQVQGAVINIKFIIFLTYIIARVSNDLGAPAAPRKGVS